MYTSGSEQEPVVGSCEHGNEPLGSTKGKGFLHSTLLTLQSQLTYLR
jgi:hypothetical protein